MALKTIWRTHRKHASATQRGTLAADVTNTSTKGTKVKPIPEGYTSLTPFLCIDGASAAIDFYTSVFGAEVVDRMEGPAERHRRPCRARLRQRTPSAVGSQRRLQARRAGPPQGRRHPSIALYCEDTDAIVARADKAGATIREPAQTFVTGDRFASLLDPFGQRWTVMTRVEDVSSEERDRRMAEWAGENV